MVEDGSLRNNGREFVSKVLTKKEIDKALEELNSVFAEFAQTHASFRCGTHIHYNMSDRTLQQTLEFLLASGYSFVINLVFPTPDSPYIQIPHTSARLSTLGV